VKHLGIGSTVTTHSHMESGDIKKGMRLLGGWKLRLFEETIMAVKFKSKLDDRSGWGPFASLSMGIFGIKWREIPKFHIG
jgi:hypothetical protein